MSLDPTVIPVVRSVFSFFKWLTSRVNISSKFEGTWEYECTVDSASLPFGFVAKDAQGEEKRINAHGGKCVVVVQNRFYATEIHVKGKREWQGVKVGEDIDKKTFREKFEWTSIEGAFLSRERVVYTYSVHKEPVKGITFLDLTFDKNTKELIIEGHFYYFPDNLIGKRDPYLSLVDRQQIQSFGGLFGKIVLTKRVKH